MYMKHTLKHNNIIYLYKTHSQATGKHISGEGTGPRVFTESHTEATSTLKYHVHRARQGTEAATEVNNYLRIIMLN